MLKNKSQSIDFEMVVKKPMKGEGAGSFRSIFFYINAFDNLSGKNVSTLRLSDTCSDGVVRCSLNTHAGQFNLNAQMKDFKSGLSFEPIALNNDFFTVNYYGPEAPHLFILTNTASQFYYNRNKSVFKDEMNEFINFYTDEKVIPDFGGFDAWVLSTCGS